MAGLTGTLWNKCLQGSMDDCRNSGDDSSVTRMSQTDLCAAWRRSSRVTLCISPHAIARSWHALLIRQAMYCTICDTERGILHQSLCMYMR